MNYVIKDTNDGMMLQHLSLTGQTHCVSHDMKWTAFPKEALHFNYEEAQAVIQFINDVLDWELAQDLEVAELKF